MKKLLRKLMVILVIFILGYLAYYPVFRIEEGNFALIEDRKDGINIGVLDSGFHFIPQGVLPDRISIIKFRKRKTEFFNLKIQIPLMVEMKSEFYSVKIPVSLLYQVNPAKLSVDFHGLRSDKMYFNRFLNKLLLGYFSKEFSQYLAPFYRGSTLKDNVEKEALDVYNIMREHCQRFGIEIIELRIIGDVQIPDMNTYLDGIRFYKEIMTLEKNSKKELIIMESKLQRDKLHNAQLYQKLNEISKLIKKNPDLLKYIYINKMADKVKVIVAPEKSGMPFGLDFRNKERDTKNKDEIDNLR